jgi:MFS family permease
MAPGLIVSPLAGALLDRMGAPAAIAIDIIASAGLVAALAIAGRGEIATAPLVLALVSLYSLTSPLGAAGIRSLLPRLVPQNALDRVNALDTASYALIDVLGPAVGGMLVGLAGPHPTFVVVAVLFALAAAALLPLLVRGPLGSIGLTSPRRALMEEALAGVLYVMRDRSLRGLAVAYSLYMTSWGVLVVAVPVLVSRELSPRSLVDSTVGWLWAIAGVTAGIGALLAGHLRIQDRERGAIALGSVLTAVAIYPISSSFGVVGLVIGLAIVGLCSGPVDVGLLTLRQRRTDPERLGRVIAVSMSLNLAGLPVGAAIGGYVVSSSASGAFGLAAMTALAAAVAACTLVPAHPAYQEKRHRRNV